LSGKENASAARTSLAGIAAGRSSWAPTPINQARWDIQLRDASRPGVRGVRGLSNQASRQPRGRGLPRRRRGL